MKAIIIIISILIQSHLLFSQPILVSESSRFLQTPDGKPFFWLGEANVVILADAGSDQSVADIDGDGKEAVTLDGSDSYSQSSSIVKYEWTENDSLIATGKKATVEFNLGTHTITLTIGDENGNTASDKVEILILSQSPNMLKNGDFEDGKTGWNPRPYVAPEANASFAVENGELHVSITDGGTETWHIQWNQLDMTIENGASYNMKFDARADSDRTLDAEVGMQGDPYTTFLDDTVNLTQQMQSFSLNFTMDSPTHTQSRLNFNLGTSSHDVYIDNVELYMTSLPTGISKEKINEYIPKEFCLMLNYPNPFNPTTIIRFEMPVAGNIRFEIYNMMGQHVRTLVNGFNNAGVHQINWDGLNENREMVTSGVYLCRMHAKDAVLSQKMILLR